MINNFKEVCVAMCNVVDGKNVDEVKAGMEDRSSNIFLLSRITKRFLDAQRVADKFGYIGVGAISFAEARMRQFQVRLAARGIVTNWEA